MGTMLSGPVGGCAALISILRIARASCPRFNRNSAPYRNQLSMRVARASCPRLIGGCATCHCYPCRLSAASLPRHSAQTPRGNFRPRATRAGCPIGGCATVAATRQRAEKDRRAASRRPGLTNPPPSPARPPLCVFFEKERKRKESQQANKAGAGAAKASAKARARARRRPRRRRGRGEGLGEGAGAGAGAGAVQIQTVLRYRLIKSPCRTPLQPSK